MEPIAGNERVKVYETDALTRFEDICNTTYSYDETSYNILIKKGKYNINENIQLL